VRRIYTSPIVAGGGGRLIRFLLPMLAAAVLAAGCAAPGDSAGGSGGSGGSAVRIGVSDGQLGYWSVFKSQAAAAGITVDLVNFTDYNQPNAALSQGQLQLNEFQHLEYLAKYNVHNHDTLVPVGATAVYPLPLYSLKYHAVAQIPAGSQVAIPNDAVNQGRALLVLQAAGLVSLRGGGSPLATPSDVEPAASKVTVVPVDAAQTAASLASVAGAVVNNNYATAANLGSDKILFKDDPDSPSAKPYVNVFVARAADQDNPTFRTLVAVYHDPKVQAAAAHDLGEFAVFRNDDPAALRAETASLQDTIRKASGG
jgi:D-methionine transport system substrate-binding protein